MAEPSELSENRERRIERFLKLQAFQLHQVLETLQMTMLITLGDRPGAAKLQALVTETIQNSKRLLVETLESMKAEELADEKRALSDEQKKVNDLLMEFAKASGPRH